MNQGKVLFRPHNSGPSYWGPGDRYTFLVTSEESGGKYFSMYAAVPPGGGPPPHLHLNETETFYILEGSFTFRIENETIIANPGDFINIPPNIVHNFKNLSDSFSSMILTYTPGGFEKFFEETLEMTHDINTAPPENMDEVVARYIEAAPRHGIVFV
jgi:hypothetical protein